MKQEEFDALRNGHFENDYVSEFYYAGEMENSCQSRLKFGIACSAVLHESRTTSNMQWMHTLKHRAISMVVHRVTLFDWAWNYNCPVSSVVLLIIPWFHHDHQGLLQWKLEVIGVFFWITVPQKLGKKQSKALQVNDTHSHCLQIYTHFHKCMCFYFKNIYVS